MNDIDPDNVHSSSDLRPRLSRRQQNDPVFAAAVIKLFGTSHPVVLKAVDDFLKGGPGSLDHQRLDLLAASASTFDDANHVAYMINRLPLTQMDMALESVDLHAARRQFQIALHGYRPETARKLVLDLVHDSTLTVLRDSPPDRVPEAGRNIVRKTLSKTTRRVDNECVDVMSHPFVTAEMVGSALDTVEAVIDSSSLIAQDNRRESYLAMLLLGRAVGRDLAGVVSDAQMERAWNLFERLQRPGTASSMLERAVENPRCISDPEARPARWIASNVKGFDDDAIWRMLASPAVPESLARTLVRSLHHYSSSTGIDNRLAIIRSNHYRRTDSLLPQLNSDEIDIRFASLPSRELATLRGVDGISAVRDSRALTQLVNRILDLEEDTVCALIGNPNLQPHHVDELVAHHVDNPFQLGCEGRIPNTRTLRLLTSPTFDDDQLARLLQVAVRQTDIPEFRQRVLEVAARNQSSGPLVLGLLQRLHPDLFLNPHRLGLLARHTASPQVQAFLAGRAVEQADDGLACELMGNGTLRREVWEELKERFPDVSGTPITLPHLDVLGNEPPIERSSWRDALTMPAYTAEQMTSEMLSDDAPPDRVEEIVRAALGAEPYTSSKYAISLASRFADEGKLPPEAYVELSGCTDRHVALAFATHPNSTGSAGFRLPALEKLEETARVIDTSEVARPPDSGLRSWSQLPNRDDVPLPVDVFSKQIDGATIGSLTLRVPRTLRELRAVSERMHNCLDGYGQRLAKGNDIIIAYTEDKDDIYAVMWEMEKPDPNAVVGRSPGRPLFPYIMVTEINSRFNEYNVPRWFDTGIEDLTAEVNTKVELAEMRRRRPAPRSAVLDLVTRGFSVDYATLETEADVTIEAPSLLGQQLDKSSAETTPDHLDATVAMPEPPSHDPRSGRDIGHDLQ